MKLFWHIIKFTFNAENAVYLVCSDFCRLLSYEFLRHQTLCWGEEKEWDGVNLQIEHNLMITSCQKINSHSQTFFCGFDHDVNPRGFCDQAEAGRRASLGPAAQLLNTSLLTTYSVPDYDLIAVNEKIRSEKTINSYILASYGIKILWWKSNGDHDNRRDGIINSLGLQINNVLKLLIN